MSIMIKAVDSAIGENAHKAFADIDNEYVRDVLNLYYWSTENAANYVGDGYVGLCNRYISNFDYITVAKVYRLMFGITKAVWDERDSWQQMNYDAWTLLYVCADIVKCREMNALINDKDVKRSLEMREIEWQRKGFV